jgi:hypothetical protein
MPTVRANPEGLHDQLAVVLFLDSPVVPRGKPKIQQADPLQRIRKIRRDRDKNWHRSVELTLDYSSRPDGQPLIQHSLRGDGISVPDHWVWVAAISTLLGACVTPTSGPLAFAT